MTDVADLLGFDPIPPARPRGRPPKKETVEMRRRAERVNAALEESTRRKRAEREFGDETVKLQTVHIADVQHGVTIGFLSQVFGMDPTTVRTRLKDCVPIHRRKAGNVYDLKTASQYLVKPVFNAEKYLRSMKPSELPTVLNEAYWSAMRKRQQWEEQAGHLWRTESVMEVLGDTFQTIKFAMQLWPDNVERAVGLSAEQRKMLIGMADALQNEIHHKLVKMPSLKQTKSSLSEAPVDPILETEIEVEVDEDDLI